MDRTAKQRIIDYLTILIMQDSKFVCNPHIRAKCAWMEAKRIYEKIPDEKKQRLLKLAQKRDYAKGERHLPDFWD